MEGGSAYVMYHSQRTAGGTFDTPVKLTAASAKSTSAFNPAVAPSLTSLWFTSISPQTVFEGHP
jgi:hypothetical protein